jgi:hypothetical protein
MNLGEITLETAQPLLGTLFQVTTEDGNTVELKLIEATPFELPKRPARGSKQPKRLPFSLYFLGPREPMLPQNMYDFRGAAAELPNLFIVPIGRDDEGTEYEAVFA